MDGFRCNDGVLGNYTGAVQFEAAYFPETPHYVHFARIWVAGVSMLKLLLFTLTMTTPVIAFGDMQFKGTVRDSSGTPISGAMVLIHWDSAGSTVGLSDNVGIRADLTIRTKEDGTFSVELPPGFYDVFAAALAFTPTCRKIRAKGGEPVEIQLRMNVDPLYTAEMGNRVETARPATPQQRK